ncbi:MAG: PAS domain S-box protein [Thalassobaculum sp.]|uniref:sensor histidine kinase n=1 Tax=Thalassobaculum sp. TaxID=2022740 RepID=UPI0032EC3205
MIDLLPLLQNLGLLSLGAVVVFLILQQFRLPRTSRRRSAVLGLVLGAVAGLVMSAPAQGLADSAFHTGAGPLVLAGVFGGPVAAGVAAAIAGVARHAAAGPGVLGEVAAMGLYAVAGGSFGRLARRRTLPPVQVFWFPVLSVVATLVVLPSFYVGQSLYSGGANLAGSWASVLLGTLLGVTLLGLALSRLLETAERGHRLARFLDGSEVARRAAGIGVWRYDLRRNRVEWDKVQHELIGLAPGEFGGTYDAFRDIVDSADRPRFDAAFRNAIRTRTPFSDLYRARTVDGRIKHLGIHADFATDTDGTPEVVVGVNVDRTAELALQAELWLKSAAVDSAVCGITITEATDGVPIVFVNQAFTTITGYRLDEVAGRNCSLLSDGLPDQPELRTIRQAIAEKGTCAVTLRNRRKDGVEFWNALRVAPIRNAAGRVTHFIGVQEDVSEQIRSRRAVANARDELGAVLAAAPDAMLTVDREQRISRFNAAATRLFGWTHMEIVGQSLELLLPESIRVHHRSLAAGFIDDPLSRPGPMSGQRIIEAKRRDGSVFPALVSLARYQSTDGPAVAVVAHDMSDIVAVQDDLKALSEQLRDQLRSAEAANLAKSRFLAGMSHEFRTPLNAILGFTEMIRHFGPGKLGTAKTAEYLDHIHQSGSHLLEIISDILDLSRVEADSVALAIAVHDAGGIVGEAIDVIGPLAEAKGVVIERAVSEVVLVRCDPRALRQCLLNLLSNAVKYAPSGSTVEIGAVDGPEMVRIVVADQGPGFPKALVDRIGEPFLRLTDPSLASAEGTGLGLAITQKLVLRQHGTLHLGRRPGGGTEAMIGIPSGRSEPSVVGSERRQAPSWPPDGSR